MHPLVSVLMITHNHASFIGRSIESVLSQKTSFQVELVIGEDASKDATAEIVKRYANRYPDKIFAFSHQQNIGHANNFFHTLSRCRGKYIALLDGDDRWINAKKLQLQVDFLERNPHIMACGGDTVSENANSFSALAIKKLIKRFKKNRVTKFDREEMIVSNRFRTLTVLGRAEAFRLSYEKIPFAPVLDWQLYINMSSEEQGLKYANLPHLFAAYNVHANGVYSGTSYRRRLEISAGVRESISALTRGRYFGWHFPLCRLCNPEKYHEKFLAAYYKNEFPEMSEKFLYGDWLAQTDSLLNETNYLVESFGYVFGTLYLQSKSFEEFSSKIVSLMRKIDQSPLNRLNKKKLLGCIGTAWRDTLFYAAPQRSLLYTFLTSPLKLYSQLTWFSLFQIYREKHIN